MIVSVFVRRLKPGCTLRRLRRRVGGRHRVRRATRVFNAQSLDDPRDVISVGFVASPPRRYGSGSRGSGRSRPA